MRAAVYFALLAQVLILHPASLCTQTTALSISDLHADSQQGNRVGPEHSSARERGPDALRRRAEAAFQRATTLRERQTAKDLLVAARVFRASARLFGAAGSYEQAAGAYLQAGDIYATLSRYEKARASYSEALRGQDPEKRCKALSRIARTYAATGPFSLVDRYSKEALDSCRNLSELAQAEALEARGEALLELAGERAQSEYFFRQARELFVRGGDKNGEARTLLALAHIRLFSGEGQAEGLESAEQALQLWSSTENNYGIARMRSYLGIFATTRGEVETAQCNYNIARGILHRLGSKDDEASVLNGLGLVNRQSGDWQKSLAYHQQARAIFASVHDMHGEIVAITEMGKTLAMMGNYRPLMPLYRKEFHQARESGLPVAIADSLADMAVAYEATNRYVSAEAFYRRSLETYQAAHNLYGEATALKHLGRLQAKRGRYSQAIAFLESE